MIATEHPDRITERHFLADKSLVLYLPLWKRDGSQFPSDDVRGHLCTNIGSIWTPQGRQFDGVDDVITLPLTTPLLLTSAQDFTLIAWVKALRPPGGGSEAANIFSFWVTTLQGIGLIISTDGYISFRERNATESAAIQRPAAENTWVMVAATNVGGTYAMQLFFNAVLRGSATGYLTGTPTVISVGGNKIISGSERYLEGTVGEIALYGRVLPISEIRRNYELTKWRYL